MRKGYVHQDISPGNIIFYEGRAKLSDLEFAKKYMSGALSDVRTVSQPPSNILFFLLLFWLRVPTNFMAVEVESGAYMNQADGNFSHNPLHDLESLRFPLVGVFYCAITSLANFETLLCNSSLGPQQRLWMSISTRLSTTTSPRVLKQPWHVLSLLKKSGHLTTCLEPHISHRHLRPGWMETRDTLRLELQSPVIFFLSLALSY